MYTKITIKYDYKNIQNKWQDNYAKWFIELNKKKILKKIVFKKFQRIWLKMILNEWFQFIYLKKSQFIFLISFVFNFQESYLHLILLKEFIKNNIYKKKERKKRRKKN